MPLPGRTGVLGACRARSFSLQFSGCLAKIGWKECHPQGLRIDHAKATTPVKKKMICTGETYTNIVKMTFAKGGSLDDLSGLFNSSLEGNTRRAIDFHEDDKMMKRR
jgi:hypothetical protein